MFLSYHLDFLIPFKLFFQLDLFHLQSFGNEHKLFDKAYPKQLLYFSADLSNPNFKLQSLLEYGQLLQLSLFCSHAIHLRLKLFLSPFKYLWDQFWNLLELEASQGRRKWMNEFSQLSQSQELSKLCELHIHV